LLSLCRGRQACPFVVDRPDIRLATSVLPGPDCYNTSNGKSWTPPVELGRVERNEVTPTAPEGVLSGTIGFLGSEPVPWNSPLPPACSGLHSTSLLPSRAGSSSQGPWPAA